MPFRIASLAFSVSMDALSSTRIAPTFFWSAHAGVLLQRMPVPGTSPRGNAGRPPRERRAARGAGSDQMNELISIVSSRPGPTPIAEIGAPDISSSAFTYAWAFFGRSAKVFALEMSSFQPGSIS